MSSHLKVVLSGFYSEITGHAVAGTQGFEFESIFLVTRCEDRLRKT